MVPVTLMIVQTGAVFGPWLGALYALAGALCAAAAAWGVGRILGEPLVARLGERHRMRFVTNSASKSVLAIAAFRMLPVAPFLITNLAAGAARVPLRYFLPGTALGMGPGILALSVFGGALLNLFSRPSLLSLLVLVVVAAGCVSLGVWFRRRFLVRTPRDPFAPP
jgi:uncharacterized membrane protein YdjX (TVP38/TMEM64 family)